MTFRYQRAASSQFLLPLPPPSRHSSVANASKAPVVLCALSYSARRCAWASLAELQQGSLKWMRQVLSAISVLPTTC